MALCNTMNQKNGSPTKRVALENKQDETDEVGYKDNKRQAHTDNSERKLVSNEDSIDDTHDEHTSEYKVIQSR